MTIAAPVQRADIEAAALRIGPHVRVTPTIHLAAGAFGLAAPLVLKLELLQHTGSFKPRGAFNRLLSAGVPPAGVIAASGGNHGVAAAYAARQLGHSAEIFVPETASPVKVERLRRYGARVTQVGTRYADALAASAVRARETGALVVHAYDQLEVVAGQGTVGRELEQQMPELDTVLVAVGGGGLIGGVAAWYAGDADDAGDAGGGGAGRARVISVEPEGAPTLASALAAGRPVPVDVRGVAMDSLGASQIGELAFAIAARHVERAVLVGDEAIVAAQRALWEELRLVAEPGGATALAALLSGAYRPEPGERVAVVVCGSNADPRSFA